MVRVRPLTRARACVPRGRMCVCALLCVQEIYDWNDGNDEQSDPILLTAGASVSATLTYVKSSNGYLMNMTSSSASQKSNYHYNLLPVQKETESAAYFVLEHQPDSCDQLPAAGKVTWTDIKVEVNGKAVASPTWVAGQEGPVCGSQAVVVNPSTVEITWQTSRSP